MPAQPTPSYVALPDAFTPEELNAIERLGDGLATAKATIADQPAQAHYDAIRITQTAWITQSADAQWLYERITRLVQSLNARFYQFELSGYSDPFQYTVYPSHKGAHYDWHVDQGAPTGPRKLSLTLQLTDPAHYEEGDLQLQAGNQIDTAPRERGMLVAFPSWVLHRVTPVTSGTRKSLVVWAAGPKFR